MEERNKRYRPIQRARWILLSTSLILLLVAAFIPLPHDSLQDVLSYSSSQSVLDREGGLLHVALSKKDEWCIPIPLETMGKWLPLVVVGIEDKRFYKHCGIDFWAIGRAILTNLKSGRTVSGASTITSQLIRISRPQKRTLLNKCREFWSATQLEKKLTKNEILELYLNKAPLGGNLRGVEAGSLAYFNKRSAQLSLSEAVLLVSLLKAPGKLRPDRYPKAAIKIRNRRIKELFTKGVISEEEMEISLKEAVEGKRFPMPQKTPMLYRQVKRLVGDKKRIRTNIDVKIQKVLEENLKIGLKGFSQKITAAGIVVENEDSSVRAYVGNIRQGSGLPGSEVDCGNAPRSPGSALKPFVYAAVFDTGILTPASLLADTPLSFKGVAPRNFDLSYRGPVNVRHALSVSLNVPAVRVLRMLGYSQALNLYRKLGFRHFQKDAEYYADSLVLGGCEVTLLELTTAYHLLVKEGDLNSLNWVGDIQKGISRKVISPEAAYLTLSILKDQRRLLPLYREDPKLSMREVAFKTGTSYGYRDAWCAGVSPRFTIVLWLGSPDGTSSPELLGLRAAAPIFLKLFRDLDAEGKASFKIPRGIYKRTVCSLSGHLPGKYCENKILDLAIVDVSSTKICDLHQNTEGEISINWPPELKGWVQKETYKSIDREPLFSLGDQIKILSPTSNEELIAGLNEQSVRAYFSAEGSGKMFWFLNGRYIGSEENGSGVFFDVPVGRHRATVFSGDESDEVCFSVIEEGEMNRVNPILLD